MLTDLTFIQTGAAWPPVSEQDRMQTYIDNRKLFEAEHAGINNGVFAEAFKRIMREAADSGIPTPAVSYEVVVNFPKLISVSTAGLLFNKIPGIVAGDKNDTPAMLAAQDITERSALQDTLYTCALDVSRFGDGLLLVRDEGGKGIIDLSRPDVWYPVVDGANIRRVQYHVLATPYVVNSTSSVVGVPPEQYLRIEIHSKGSYEIRDHKLYGGRIGELVTETPGKKRIVQTGMTDFSVIPVPNLRTSDRVHGFDDYADIQALVCELEVRMAQIATVLDRHTNPTMQGPEDALQITTDADGNVQKTFIPGQYFVNQAGATQGKIEYITWDAELEANYKYIEKVIELIRVISGMGSLLSDLSDKSGAIPSGAAMRRMLYNAISKIARLRNNFAAAIKKALLLASQVSGTSLVGKSISIDWPDPLPRDPKEMAEIANMRTGSKQTQSTKRAIMELDEMSEEDAEEELEVILDEQAAAMAAMLEPSKEPDEPTEDDKQDGVDEGV
jgi:hypothetical protein